MSEHAKNTIEALVSDGLLTNDVEILSNHNNLILVSPSQKIVSRIARLTTMEKREDPGDIRYSHEASYIAGEVASVTQPLTRYPREENEFIISDYPERQPIDWNSQDTSIVAAAVRRLNNSLDHVASYMQLRTLDIPSYAASRINHALAYGSPRIQGAIEVVIDIMDEHAARYPFHELIAADNGLVHGDLHATNLVKNDSEGVEMIDMDSLAIGAKTYDMSSWRVRRELGDEAPVETIIEHFRTRNDWDEDIFHALMGWKIISSMTHVLRYEEDTSCVANKINKLGRCGIILNALHASQAGDMI